MQKMIIQKKQRNTYQKITKTVLTYSILLGIIPGFIYIIMMAVGFFAVFPNIAWILLIAYGCGFLLIGILVTWQTRKVRSSVLTALLAGAIEGGLVCGYLLAKFLTQPALTLQFSEKQLFPSKQVTFLCFVPYHDNINCNMRQIILS